MGQMVRNVHPVSVQGKSRILTAHIVYETVLDVLDALTIWPFGHLVFAHIPFQSHKNLDAFLGFQGSWEHWCNLVCTDDMLVIGALLCRRVAGCLRSDKKDASWRLRRQVLHQVQRWPTKLVETPCRMNIWTKSMIEITLFFGTDLDVILDPFGIELLTSCLYMSLD